VVLAIVGKPPRDPGKGFEMAFRVTVPLPVPLVGFAVSHNGSPVTTHPHFEPVAIAMLCGPPVCANASPPAESE
jgi:hypothetical protein